MSQTPPLKRLNRLRRFPKEATPEKLKDYFNGEWRQNLHSIEDTFGAVDSRIRSADASILSLFGIAEGKTSLSWAMSSTIASYSNATTTYTSIGSVAKTCTAGSFIVYALLPAGTGSAGGIFSQNSISSIQSLIGAGVTNQLNYETDSYQGNIVCFSTAHGSGSNTFSFQGRNTTGTGTLFVDQMRVLVLEFS